MVNRNLLRDLYDVEDLDHEVATAMADAPEQFDWPWRRRFERKFDRRRTHHSRRR